MTYITIEGKEYEVNVRRAVDAGYLKERGPEPARGPEIGTFWNRITFSGKAETYQFACVGEAAAYFSPQVTLISLQDGNRWRDPLTCLRDISSPWTGCVTPAEWDNIKGGGNWSQVHVSFTSSQIPR